MYDHNVVIRKAGGCGNQDMWHWVEDLSKVEMRRACSLRVMAAHPRHASIVRLENFRTFRSLTGIDTDFKIKMQRRCTL
jgi:hypothetical protein